jgi:alanyl-tRNA synthetase
MTKRAIKTIDRKQLIKKYIDFFKSKNHKQIPNSSLIPENDPTVLFTTAGMHPIVPYLLGEKHPLGKRLVNVQKCIRTQDIDDVGDKYHHTFFEMLGNWSLGDYWKKQAIEMSFEFLTETLKIPKQKLSISCFKGNPSLQIPRDNESAKIWKSLGISKSKIKFLGKQENWWGPAGKTGPCGPDTEMFFNNIEIWNDVFMQYNKTKAGRYEELKQKNVDTGMGVERTVTILSGLDDDYLSSCFLSIIREIEKLSKKSYGKDKDATRAMRIMADHIKASVFIIADNIIPSNIEQGYVLRKLIRRAIRYGRFLNIKGNFSKQLAKPVFKIYPDYEHLQKNKEKILKELEKEERNFLKTLEKGINIFNKISKNKKKLSAKQAFLLYQSYGFPLELTQDLAREKNIKINTKGFENEFKKHQKLSRTATSGRFKSGLADHSEKVTKLHTATHLLNQALRQVLKKPDLHQCGSNITSERLRFDFNFPRKLTEKELKEVESWINKKIQEKLPVKCKEMTLEQAKKLKAQGVFESKYQGIEKLKVYLIGKNDNLACSKEICAGPHVSNLNELGKFRILKEESSAAGVRRIKANLE